MNKIVAVLHMAKYVTDAKFSAVETKALITRSFSHFPMNIIKNVENGTANFRFFVELKNPDFQGQVGFLLYQYDINKNIIGNGPVARSIKIDVDNNQTIIMYTFTGLDPDAQYILINTDDEWSSANIDELTQA